MLGSIPPYSHTPWLEREGASLTLSSTSGTPSLYKYLGSLVLGAPPPPKLFRHPWCVPVSVLCDEEPDYVLTCMS